MRFFLVSAISCAMLLSCSNAGERASNLELDSNLYSIDPASISSNQSDSTTLALGGLLLAYLRLKDGLVEENKSVTYRAAQSVLLHVHNLDSLWPVPGQALKPITANLFMTAKDSAGNFPAIRLHFRSLTDSLYTVLKNAELKGFSVYRFYDPAAFNDAGAYWLSHSPEIRNPYFGPKMPEWGEVSDTL